MEKNKTKKKLVMSLVMFQSTKNPCLSVHCSQAITNNHIFQYTVEDNKEHKIYRNLKSTTIFQSVLNTKR